MKKTGLYSDLGKTTRDFLEDEYPDKLLLKSKLQHIHLPFLINGVTTLERKEDGSVLGTAKPEVKFETYGVGVGGSANTNRQFSAFAALHDKILPGFKASINYKHPDREVSGECKYEHKHFSLTSGISRKGNTSVIGFSPVLGYRGFLLGSKSEYVIGEKQELKTLEGTLGYKNPFWDVTAYIKDKGEKLGLSYFQKFGLRTSVGADASLDVKRPMEQGSSKLDAGVSYKLSEDTLLKGKVNTDGRVGLAYIQDLNDNARMAVACSTKITNLKSTNEHKFGFTFNIRN